MGLTFSKVVLLVTAFAAGACASTPLGARSTGLPRQAAPAPPAAQAALGPRGPEQARYRIRHAFLGDLGEVAVRMSPGALADTKLWVGEGSAFGSFLGIGESSTFRSEFNANTGLSTKWTINRDTGSAKILDECEQTHVGEIASHRVHSKKPEDWSTLHAGEQTTDPFGFLLRLRTRPPGASETVMVLDGRALWRVTVSSGKPDRIDVSGRAISTLRYQLHSDPLDWQRAPSKTRKTQDLTIWLAATDERTPLALEVRSAFGNVRIERDESAASTVAQSN